VLVVVTKPGERSVLRCPVPISHVKNLGKTSGSAQCSAVGAGWLASATAPTPTDTPTHHHTHMLAAHCPLSTGRLFADEWTPEPRFGFKSSQLQPVTSRDGLGLVVGRLGRCGVRRGRDGPFWIG